MSGSGFETWVTPTPEGLAEASRNLATYLAGQAVPEPAIGRVELVLEEVVMNAMTHGAPAAGPLRIRLSAMAGPDACHLTILDNGAAFDPVTAPARQDGASLDQVRPGGLGLVLLRRFARGLRYQRVPFGNQLELAIPLPPAVPRP